MTRQNENNQRRSRRNAPGAVERESTQRVAAREEPGVREQESAQRAAARATRTFDMACKYVDGKYIFHQTCGLWNAPCVHGCGYLHLSSSTLGSRKKCCANGRLSSASENFDKELMMDHELNQLPNFFETAHIFILRLFTLSSTYNNLVAMGATAVCNLNNTNGFT